MTSFFGSGASCLLVVFNGRVKLFWREHKSDDSFACDDYFCFPDGDTMLPVTARDSDGVHTITKILFCLGKLNATTAAISPWRFMSKKV